tara:strand:+ start:18292 stop:18999 length:708 start_codon:yes stop_codon:yes gene_type:complete
MKSKEIDNDNLILSHIPLAKSLAFKFKNCFPSFYDQRDIIGVAVRSLVSCVDTFNPSKGRSFGSYSSMRINGSLIDEVRKNDQLSRSCREKFNRVKSAILKIENRTRMTATDSEIIKELKISKKDYKDTKRSIKLYSFVDLDSPNKGSSEKSPLLRDVISDSDRPTAKENAEHNDNILLLKNKINSLPEKQKNIINSYYFDELTLSEIGKKIKLSEGRVSQILSQTINSLKKYFK